MIAVKSTYYFSLPGLARLASSLDADSFNPDQYQTLVLRQALQLLDLELSHQAAEHPEFVDTVNQLLADSPN